MLQTLSGNRDLGTAWSLTSPGGFFQIVVDHSMQGFYGDPRHGGNRDGASWKMLGLSYPPIRGRLRTELPKSRSS
jgi:gluconate 2-dehydrogenase gamma chain